MVIGLFTGGKERLVLPTWPYLALIATVSGAVYVLSTTSCQKISTRTKQLLCIPLFAINILLPLYIASPIFVLTILGELHLFNIVLRFSEVIYVQSLVYGKPAEISGAALSAEFASIMRLKTQDKGKAKRVPWYHLLVPISLYILLTNVIASWYTTFEGPEVIEIPHNSILYFIFFVFAVVIMTSVTNAFGYFGLMVHVIMDEGGTFVQDEWRPLWTCLSSLHRWGRFGVADGIKRSNTPAIPFRPVKVLSKPVIGNTAANILATISVFFVSGLMHEYLIICEVGTEAYFKRFVGQECFFFTIHGVAVLFERWFQQRFQIPSNLATRFLGHVWVIAFAFLTFPWFLDSFAYFGVWHANPFNTFVPYLIDNVWRKHPILRPFCGNLL